MATAGNLVVNILGNTMGLQQSLQKGISQTSAFLTRMRSFAIGAAVSLAGAFSLGSAISSAQEARTAMATLESVVRSTGGAAGLSADEIATFAAELQTVTNFEGDATKAAAAMLATFTNIRGDVFTEAIVAAQDLSTVVGQDLRSSMTQLGKALNDPIQGITALRKIGVSFTDQQREQIKTLVESGNILGAQRIILKELNTEFGGAAKATANPWIILQNAVGDLAENIGELLLPSVHALSKGMTQLVGFVNDNSAAFLAIGNSLGRIVQFAMDLPGPLKVVAAAIMTVVAASWALQAAQRAAAISGITLQAVLNPATLLKVGASLAVAAALIAALDQGLKAAGASAPETNQQMQGLAKTLREVVDSADGAGSALEGMANRSAATLRAVLTDIENFQKAEVYLTPRQQARGAANLQENKVAPLAGMELFPKADKTKQQVEELSSLLQDVQRQAATLGQPLAQSLEAQLTAKIGELTGVSKAIADAQRELDKLQPGGERKAMLKGLYDKGATTEQIRELDALLTKVDQAKFAQEQFQKSQQLRVEGIDQITRLRDEIDKLSGAATESAIALREMERRGIPQDQLTQIEALQKERDELQELEKLRERAKQIVEQSRTPEQKMADDIAELDKLKSLGLLTQAQYDQARTKVDGGTGAERKQGPGAALAGTQDAVSSVLRAASGGNKGQEKLQKTADQQLAQQEKTVELLGDIARKGGLGSTDLT